LISWKLRIEIVCIIVVVVATLLARLFLIGKAPFVYGQDAYNYINSASSFASTGKFSFEAGFPFIVILGAFLRFFNSIATPIIASRVFMLINSSLLAVLCYLIGSKMCGRLFGIIAALVITFEPYFLTFSIVAYNNVFAVSAGLFAFYFLLTNNKLLKYILAPLFFYLGVFTRPDLYFALILPIIAIHLWSQTRTSKEQPRRYRLTLMWSSFALIYFIPALVLYYFIQPYGRIGIIERIAVFLRPDLINTVITASFSFSPNLFLNQLSILLVALGLFLLMLKTTVVEASFVRDKSNHLRLTFRTKSLSVLRRTILSSKSLVAFCLLLAFFMEVFALTLWGFNYTWAFTVDNQTLSNVAILKQAIVIIPQLHERYAIFPMLIIAFPLAYPLYFTIEKIVVKIRPNSS
jgi:hypothetical protein